VDLLLGGVVKDVELTTPRWNSRIGGYRRPISATDIADLLTAATAGC
jgi:hypothetical protein